ncbi:FAD/NAD(P)-binding domain-containing protein [Biscogniauxia mediterranea]|nr:FAD/NAD(P)-binding domain-containing protein [Biscogniauxia mediterranea]
MSATTSTTTSTPLVDVLILGAGPAGLACATALSRQLHTCLVLSSAPSSSSSPSPSPSPSSSPSAAAEKEQEKGEKGGQYQAPHFRNARARHMHNVLGWEHADPAAFRARARADLEARYGDTAAVRDGVDVVRVERIDDGGKETQGSRTRFRAVDATGAVYEGRKLVLACGIRDVMPDIPGYAELWGRGIFHCLFCHGYESRGRASVGVLAAHGLLAKNPPTTIAAMCRMAGRLAARSSVTVYTDGADADAAGLRAAGLRSRRRFRVDERRIVGLARDPEMEGEEGEAGVLVMLADGSVAREGFLAHVPNFELGGPASLITNLHLQLAAQGHIEARPPFWATSAPGVYAAGDCATPLRSVAMAAAMGAAAAAGLAHELQAEDDDVEDEEDEDEDVEDEVSK